MLFGILLALVASPPARALPDLVPTLRVTGAARLDRSGNYLLPVRVSVRNAGNDIAGRFKMSAEFNHISFGGTRATAFSGVNAADGSFRGDQFHSWTQRALFPGAVIGFAAFVFIPKSVPRGSTVTLRVSADSCTGEEFMPVFCRVEEIHEENNRTALTEGRLP